MTEEMIDNMAEAGFIYVEYGIETMDSILTTKINKNIDREKSKKLYEYTKKKIPFVVDNYLNFNDHDLLEVLNLTNKEYEYDNDKMIRPYPGTVFGDYIYSKYANSKESQWQFLQKYLWWKKFVKKYRNMSSLKKITLRINYKFYYLIIRVISLINRYLKVFER